MQKLKFIEFKAMFEYLPNGKKIWLISTVNNVLPLHGKYVQKTDWLQYVGKNDIHGKKIYEGDIFKFKFLEELHKPPIELVGSFSFGEDLSFEIDVQDNDIYTCLHYVNNGTFYDFEIVGNIYDKKE